MRILLTTMLLIPLGGCSVFESEFEPQAEIVIYNVIKEATEYGPVALQLKVTNIGAADASGVLVRSYPVKSGDDLTDGTVTYFNPDSGIAQGDSA